MRISCSNYASHSYKVFFAYFIEQLYIIEQNLIKPVSVCLKWICVCVEMCNYWLLQLSGCAKIQLVARTRSVIMVGSRAHSSTGNHTIHSFTPLLLFIFYNYRICLCLRVVSRGVGPNNTHSQNHHIDRIRSTQHNRMVWRGGCSSYIC